jgi:hypothetical protein
MDTEMLRGVYPERSEGLSMTIPVLIVKNLYRGGERSENATDLQHIFSCYSSQKNAIIIMFHSMEIRIGRVLG